MKIFISLLLATAFLLGITLDHFNILDREVGEPLYRLSIFIAIPFALILLSRGSALGSWLRFARWWIPGSILLILVAPPTNNTWMPILGMAKETATWVTGALFTLVSIVIIVRSNRTSRTAKRA